MARGRSAGKLFSEPAILAFAIGGLFPAASILASWIKFRRADWIGVVILSTLVGGLITAFFTGKIEFAAIKAAPAFGLFGLGVPRLSFFKATADVLRGPRVRKRRRSGNTCLLE